MKHTILNSIAKAINAYLRLDPESNDRLSKINGKVITIEFMPMHFIFQCVFADNKVSVQQDNILESDAKISGTPLQMLGVMLTKENRQRFFAEDLQIEGNAEFAQQVTNLFDEIEIDWEEPLSQLIGDAPAHHAGRFIRRVSNWLQSTSDALAQDINEYIHEEAVWLPTEEALQDFFNEIDTMRMDVDRIEVKLQQIRELLANAKEEASE